MRGGGGFEYILRVSQNTLTGTCIYLKYFIVLELKVFLSHFDDHCLKVFSSFKPREGWMLEFTALG